MWKWLGTSLLLIIASTVFAMQCRKTSGQPDCGFVQNTFGERVSWKNENLVTLYIHESVPDQFVGAIKSAAATWEKNIGDRKFNLVLEKMQGPLAPHQDGKNIIYFMDTWEDGKSSEQARTSIYWNGDQIVEADIRVNNKDFEFYWQKSEGRENKVNFEALVLHEMGHVLGLKHKDDVGSVMATYLPNGVDRVRLAARDIHNLQCEYQM